MDLLYLDKTAEENPARRRGRGIALDAAPV